MALSPQELSLESIVSTAISIPGVKVDRNAFLTEFFKNEDVDLHQLIDLGPVEANCSREMLNQMATKLILDRTSKSSIMSFLAGLPGGFAMGAAIPADVLQYFAVALRLAQELSYLYGSKDLWHNGELDTSLVNGQLILYCGVMFGVSGAANGVRLLSAQLAKTAAKKIPQKTLTKTFWYPIMKQIGKALSIKVTKSTFANGVAKVIPIVGGVISGGITFASMLPMGKRLALTLDDAYFDYTDEEIAEDIAVIEEICQEESVPEEKKARSMPLRMENMTKGIKNLGSGMSGMLSKAQKTVTNARVKIQPSSDDAFEKIEKLAKLYEAGAITEEEFESKKAELLTRI